MPASASQIEKLMEADRAAAYKKGWDDCKSAIAALRPADAKPKPSGKAPKAAKSTGKRTIAPRGQHDAAILDYMRRAAGDTAMITVGSLKKAGHEIGKTSLDNVRKRLVKDGKIERVGDGYRLKETAKAEG